MWGLHHPLYSLLLGLLLAVHKVRHQKCLHHDGHQWLGVLHFSPSGVLPGLAVVRGVRNYTWSGAYADVLWEIVGDCHGDHFRLYSGDRTRLVQRQHLLATNPRHCKPFLYSDESDNQLRHRHLLHGRLCSSLRHHFALLLPRNGHPQRPDLRLPSQPKSHLRLSEEMRRYYIKLVMLLVKYWFV